MSHLLVFVTHGLREESVLEQNHQIADVSKLTEHSTPAGRGDQESVFTLLVSVMLSSSPLLCRVIQTQILKRHRINSIVNICCKQLYILCDCKLISSKFLTQWRSVSTQPRVYPTHVPFACLFHKICLSEELLFFVLIELQLRLMGRRGKLSWRRNAKSLMVLPYTCRLYSSSGFQSWMSIFGPVPCGLGCDAFSQSWVCTAALVKPSSQGSKQTSCSILNKDPFQYHTG